jgi:hypothetical protein
VPAALVCAATLIAACGGGGNNASPGAKSRHHLTPAEQMRVLALASNYSHCMQTHGVPDFPNPAVDPDGRVSIRLGALANSIDPGSTQYRQASRACESVRAQLP